LQLTSFRCRLLSFLKFFCVGSVLAGFSSQAWAAGGGGLPHVIDYYFLILHSLGLDKAEIKVWSPILGSFFATGLVVVLGLVFRSGAMAAVASGEVAPQSSFSVRTFVEMVMEFLQGLCKEGLGSHWKEHMTLIAGLFFFILLANLSGLVPGFPPSTANMGVNLSLGLIVFFVYNWAGFREHGFAYLKHFLGPVLWISPLIFLVEIISHTVRPLSLGARLLINVFADHLIVGAATSIVPLLVPSVLMFFGLLVCFVQSYVFALLTVTYVSMATSHDH
jgi:F-type H+-transporting ATPase subunit a